MTGKKYKERLFLDIPFGEALERFAETNVKEVRASVARAKKAKPSGGTGVLPIVFKAAIVYGSIGGR